MQVFQLRCLGLGVLLGPALLALLPASAQQTAKPYRVTIVEGKDEVAEHLLPLDPTLRAGQQYGGNMVLAVLGEGKQPNRLATVQSSFMVDGIILEPKTTNRLFPLPDGPNQRKRIGGHTFTVFGDIRVNLTVEVVPGKPRQTKPGAPVPRRMDTVRIHYTILNNRDVAHQVGCRLQLEPQFAGTFAAVTAQPCKVFDGALLQDRQVPAFLEILQKPDVQNPVSKGVVTFRTANQVEAPGKVVLSRRGVKGDWEVPIMPAKGQSVCFCYWESKEIAPGGQREIAVAYGQSIACRPESEGRVSIDFGGSFKPHTIFTITAYVEDSANGQHLTLLLPPGVECVGGKQTQSVPPVSETVPSVVVWSCRLLQAGSYPIRIRSSNGVTQTRIVPVALQE